MRIIGVDPGTKISGFGCIDASGGPIQYIASGIIRLSSAKHPRLEHKLLVFFEHFDRILKELRPEVVVVEPLFFAKNVQSLIQLCHLRGVILHCSASNQIAIAEYSVNEVKQAISFHGHASKVQVASWVKNFLRLNTGQFEAFDESDALALAICHTRMIRTEFGAKILKPKKNRRFTLAQTLRIKP